VVALLSLEEDQLSYTVLALPVERENVWVTEAPNEPLESWAVTERTPSGATVAAAVSWQVEVSKALLVASDKQQV
jgi:hypothetical protein